MTGRRVAVLHEGELEAGEQAIAWEGRSDRGVPLVADVCLARLEAGGTVERAKVVVRH